MRFRLSRTQVSDALHVLFQPEGTTLWWRWRRHPEESPWLLTSWCPSSFSVEHLFLLTCLFPAPSSCCHRASLSQQPCAKSFDVPGTGVGARGPCLHKPPSGEESRQEEQLVLPSLWPGCSRYRASGHLEKKVTRSSQWEGGSYTQEGPFELRLECKKREKKNIPGRRKFVQRCEHPQLGWSQGKLDRD